MLHTSRRWSVASVQDIPDLANRLHGMTYCTCAGFRLPGGSMLLNDSTGPDGAQEYAVISSDGRQVESLTVGWIEAEGELAAAILECLTGPTFYDWSPGPRQIETPEQHGRCHACA